MLLQVVQVTLISPQLAVGQVPWSVRGMGFEEGLEGQSEGLMTEKFWWPFLEFSSLSQYSYGCVNKINYGSEQKTFREFRIFEA